MATANNDAYATEEGRLLKVGGRLSFIRSAVKSVLRLMSNTSNGVFGVEVGSQVTTFSLTDSSAGAGRLISIGVPLAEGQIAAGESLIVTKADDTVVPSQWNKLASWRTDGSQLHGVLTFETVDAGDNSGTYKIKKGGAAGGAAITKSDIVASGFDAVVVAAIGGSNYSLSAADLLSGAVTPRQDYTHFSGPLAAEYIVGGPLRIDGTGTQHGTLQAYFYVRAFGNPVTEVYVTISLENTGAFNALSNVATDSVDVTVGGSSVSGLPKPSFTVYADCRYVKRAWWNSDPGLFAFIDKDHMRNTNLIPSYYDITIVESELSNYPQSTDWNQNNVISGPSMHSPGTKPELCPYDRWSAAFLISGDQRAFNALRAAQDEYSYMVGKSGSYLFRPRDENTGQVVDAGVHGHVSSVWGGTDVFAANRDTVAAVQTDLAHFPSIGYIPYLLTADGYDLENVQFAGLSPWINERPGGYVGTIPGRRFGEKGPPRAIAWGFRCILNAGFITPDNHPVRNTFEAAVTNALDELNTRARPTDPIDATGLILTEGTGTAVVYDGGTGFAPWQQDFLNWTIGFAYVAGWKPELDTSGFWAWKAKSIVQRLGPDTVGFCWEYGAYYSLIIRDTETSPFYQTWAEIFDNNFPGVSTCAAKGSPMASGDNNSDSYGAQMAGGLAMAVITGMPGAAEAWDLYINRDISHWTRPFTEDPEWAINERGLATIVRNQIDVSAQGAQWLSYEDGTPYFIMGLGDPEEFLYMGTEQVDGTRSGGGQDADITRLINQGGNCIYMQAVRTHGGDDGTGTHNPFINHTPGDGMNQNILDQWKTWFNTMDANGITILFFFYDDSSNPWGDSGSNTLSQNEKDFIDSMVSNFSGYEHLIWVFAEEYDETFTDARASAFAAYLRSVDTYNHPIAMHTRAGDVATHGDMEARIPDDPNVDIWCIQNQGSTSGKPNPATIHGDVVLGWTNAAGRYHVGMWEVQPQHGKHGEANDRQVNWACIMGGATVAVLRWDLDTNPTDAGLNQARYAQQFMEASRYQYMAPDDTRAAGETEWCLVEGANSFIAYSRSAPNNLGITGLDGVNYDLTWMDTVTGTQITETVSADPSAPSWLRSLAVNQAIELANTSINLVDPEDDPTYNPNYPADAPFHGTNGQRSVIDAWGGMAYDTTRHRAMPWGGGHGDYAGNELYAINLNKETPDVELWTAPSTNVGGSTNGAYPDGLPGSIHSYDIPQYCPNVDAIIKYQHNLVYPNRGDGADRIWHFDCSETNPDLYQRALNGWSLKAETADPYDSSGHDGGAYNPNDGCLYTLGSGSFPSFAKYNPVTETWTWLKEVPGAEVPAGVGQNATSALKAAHGTLGLFVATTSNSDLLVIDIDSLTMFVPTVTGATSLLRTGSGCLTYDPDNNCFWTWNGGNAIGRIDVPANPLSDSWNITNVSVTGATMPASPQTNGTFSRLQWDKIGAQGFLVLINSYNENAFVVKVSESGGGGSNIFNKPGGISGNEVVLYGVKS